MTVEVIVPWRPGCRHRERAWAWVNRRYAVYHPDWPVTVARAPAGNWIKANAVVPAVEASSAEVVIVADADVWVDDLARAVESVERGSAWAVPHWQVRRLTEKATDKLIGGAGLLGLETCEPPYHPTFGGGVVVARREVISQVPLDPRFVGWGRPRPGRRRVGRRSPRPRRPGMGGQGATHPPLASAAAPRNTEGRLRRWQTALPSLRGGTQQPGPHAGPDRGGATWR